MRHYAILEFDIGPSKWNAPTKQDFIALANWMVAKCAVNNPSCSIEVDYQNGCSANYSLSEFHSQFSTSSVYNCLLVEVIALRGFALTCTFSPHKSARVISVSAETMTLSEVEDLALSLKLAVEQLYVKHEVPLIPQVQPYHPAEVDIPAKVEVTLSEAEHSRLNEKDGENVKRDRRRLLIEILKDVGLVLIGFMLEKLF